VLIEGSAMPGSVRILALALAAVAGSACALHRGQRAVPAAAGLSHGVAVGETSSDSALVWGRCAGDGFLHVAVVGDPARQLRVACDATSDWACALRLADLAPDQAYEARVWCGAADAVAIPAGAARASFRTAPRAAAARAVRFAWSGDVGGQNVCRDRAEGYPIFTTLAAEKLDFFIALGDMIYADDPCEATGRYGNEQVVGPPPAIDLEGFRAHWRYNYADPHLQALRAATSYYAVWDDHEIRNDAGPSDDRLPGAPDRPLMPPATRAFVEYQPLPRAAAPRLYRSRRWGKHLELFFLDTRQYRDANAAPDRGALAKTLLGAEQRAWFENALAASDATWKVVVSSVPLSIPTGAVGRRDGWASYDGDTGFAREARELLRAARDAGVRNLVWITTDVHFATGFRYTPFADDPSFLVYELVCGPLHAGVFPRLDVDPSLRPERLYFWGPPTAESIQSLAEAKRWFNYAVIEIDERGELSFHIVNARGETVASAALPRAAQ
jgi:alkaline phosphatase D